MTYRRRALGQYIGKQIPGQVNFLSPELAYLPTPGYVEHGSWVTGAPDVVQWALPEGAGLYRGRGPALGQLLTDLTCSGTALNASWTARTRDTINAGLQAAVVAGLGAGVIGALSKKPLIGGIAGAAIAFGAFRTWTAPYAV